MSNTSDLEATSSHLPPSPEVETAKYYDNLATQVWRVWPPILLVTGTLGNIMAILVLSRKGMRHSIASIYLIVLSVMDLLVLYTGLLRHWIRAYFNIDVRHLGETSCRIHIWLVYVSLDASVWVLVALTFERLVSVYSPHRVKEYCTVMRSFIILGTIIGLLMAINSHFFYGLGDYYKYEEGRRVLVAPCSYLYREYDYFSSKIWPWIDLCLYSLLPISIIIVSNIAIAVKVCISRRRARRVQPTVTVQSRGQVQFKGSRKLSSMTAILVMLNMVLIITTVPVSVFIIALPYLAYRDSPKKTAQIQLVWALVNMLQYTNNSVNFILYCVSGSRFREELQGMFRKKTTAGALNISKASVVPLNRLQSQESRRTTLYQNANMVTGFTCPPDSAFPLSTTTTTTLLPPSSSAQLHHPSPPSSDPLSAPPHTQHFPAAQQELSAGNNGNPGSANVDGVPVSTKTDTGNNGNPVSANVDGVPVSTKTDTGNNGNSVSANIDGVPVSIKTDTIPLC